MYLRTATCEDNRVKIFLQVITCESVVIVRKLRTGYNIFQYVRQTQGEKVSCQEGNSPKSKAKVPKRFCSFNEVRIFEQDYI